MHEGNIHPCTCSTTPNPLSVVHIHGQRARRNAIGDRPRAVPELARHGFEIVDKRSGKEVYLDGSWAEMFQQRTERLAVKHADRRKKSRTRSSGYAELAQTPVSLH